jgi:hypothetical protein
VISVFSDEGQGKQETSMEHSASESKRTDVSGEHTAIIVGVEEQLKQEAI